MSGGALFDPVPITGNRTVTDTESGIILRYTGNGGHTVTLPTHDNSDDEGFYGYVSNRSLSTLSVDVPGSYSWDIGTGGTITLAPNELLWYYYESHSNTRYAGIVLPEGGFAPAFPDNDDNPVSPGSTNLQGDHDYWNTLAIVTSSSLANWNLPDPDDTNPDHVPAIN